MIGTAFQPTRGPEGISWSGCRVEICQSRPHQRSGPNGLHRSLLSPSVEAEFIFLLVPTRAVRPLVPGASKRLSACLARGAARAPPAGDVLAVRRPDGDFRCRFSSISGFTWGSPFRRLLQFGGTAQFKINVERTIDRLSERRHSGNGRSQLGQTAHSPSGRLAGSIWNWIFFRQALQQVAAKRRPIDEPGAKPSTPSSQR
jgi:hypothetical protein